MNKLLLAVLTLLLCVFAVSAGAQESILKRKTCEMSADSDDAEENIADGSMYLTGPLELCYHYWTGGGRDQIVGLRFPKVDIPPDVIIDSAYLQFFSFNTENEFSDLTISGEASADSSPFTDTAYNISSRSQTAASVAWTVPEWAYWGDTGLAQRSPDISAIVREIITQDGFSAESSITLFLQGNGTRIAASFDYYPFYAPKLIINYRLPDQVPNTTNYKDRYANYFPIGTSMSSARLSQLQTLGDANIFNDLTAEYEMKWNVIEPEYNSFVFDGADAVANYARANNMKMTGHTFVWEQANPAWLFEDGADGAISPAVLSERLMNHIDTMVQRYGDVVDSWDVANEVISLSYDSDKIYKDESEGSLWWAVFGSPEFVKLAFQYTAESNARHGCNSLLFYNSNEVPEPAILDKIMVLVDYLQSEGVQIDGIGLQGHWILNYYPISQIREAFDRIIAKGLKIKISEMDVSIWNVYYNQNVDYPPPLTEEALQEQAYYYQELFDLFREYKDHIQSVTFWGISDDDSWLNRDWNTWELLSDEQLDAPLLFDGNFNPKPAFYSIMDFESDADGNQQPVAVLNADMTSGAAPLTVSFDGLDSYDDDGSIVEYNWTFGDGSFATGASATHIYQTSGSYTAQLLVRDDQGGTGTASVTVTVEPSPSNVIFVQDMAMSVIAVTSKKKAAQVEVLVQNTFGDPVEEVTVSGTWSGIVSGSISGATDSNGVVTFTSSTTPKTGTITFTVNNLAKTDCQYDSGSNLMTSSAVTVN